MAKNIFITPPTKVGIHNPESLEYQGNKTTLCIFVPKNAGAALAIITLKKHPNVDTWDWGEDNPKINLGHYSLRKKGMPGLATTTQSKTKGLIKMKLNPTIEQGQQVNIVFRGVNPEAGIYQWSLTIQPQGDDPVSYDGRTLNIQIYELDDFR